MNTLTETFGKLYVPTAALLFYSRTEQDNRQSIYVEAYDIGKNGNPINAHPLSVKEGTALAKALDVTEGINRNFLRPQGLMPKNVLHINPDTDGFVIWHTPAMNAQLFFSSSLTLDDGIYALPPLVWKASKKSLAVFAIKDREGIGLDTPLYDAPFFNLYGDGRVCMGDVKIKFRQDDCLDDFTDKWQQYFFNSKFSHLIKNVSPVKGSIIQLYQSIAGEAKKFPQNKLIKSAQTLKNLIR